MIPTEPARSRLRAALPFVVLAFVVRALLGAAIAVEPARFVASTTRHFPRGELALFDQGGALLFELYYQRKITIAPTAVDLVALIVGHLLGLFVMAALVHRVAHPAASVREALRAVPPRYPLLVLATGLGTLALGLIASAGVALAFFAVAPTTPVGQGAAIALVLVPLAAFSLVLDAVRVALAATDDSLGAATARALRAIARDPAPLLLRYAAAAIAQGTLAVAAVAVAFGLALGRPFAAAAGILAATTCTLAAVAVRAWLLATLTRRVEIDRKPPE